MTTTVDKRRTEQDLDVALVDAHARGRAILESAARMIREGAEDDVAARVATTVHRFLTFTNPLHELDEEQMVFPALRANGPHDKVDAALAQLVEDHVMFDALREGLAARWERVAHGPAGLGLLRPELLAMTDGFAVALHRHQEHEELVVFPLVRKHVPAEIQARILAVMSRREAGP